MSDPKIFRVSYHVRDSCTIEVEAESEEDARNKVLAGDFEEDETYDFLTAEITDVWAVEELG